jgi:hypothetical protein
MLARTIRRSSQGFIGQRDESPSTEGPVRKYKSLPRSRTLPLSAHLSRSLSASFNGPFDHLLLGWPFPAAAISYGSWMLVKILTPYC